MKKLISLMVAMVMCLSLVPSAFAAEGASVDKFTDVPADAWYRDELAYALHNGYISGTSETTFAPDALVTRGQFVTILGRMVNADVSQFKTTQFEDVDITSWYGPYVEWARSTGIVNGVSSTQFAPDNKITVEQMSVMVSNCISKLSLSPKAAPVVYSDMSSVSTWAVSGVEAMAKYDLLPVDAANNVDPHKQATRSECTVSLVRLAQSTGMGVAPATETTNTQSSGDDYVWADVEAKVKEIHDELWATGQITQSMNEKEKAIAYFRWMCINCEYHTSEDKGVSLGVVQSEYGPLLYGFGVCSGLSKSYRMLLKSEGISCKVKNDYEMDHAWNVVTLDGKEYEIDLTEGVVRTKNADGTLNDVLFETNSFKQFYPDEWRAEKDKNSGFNKVSEEDLQRMLDELQAEYNASWNQ
jgi:hypothetical protein